MYVFIVVVECFLTITFAIFTFGIELRPLFVLGEEIGTFSAKWDFANLFLFFAVPACH